MIWPFSTIAALRADLRHAQALSHSYLGQFQDANAAKMELARQLAEACREREEALAHLSDAHDERDAMADTAINARLALEIGLEAANAQNEKMSRAFAEQRHALAEIAELGAASKNGTARKLGRMAGEAAQ